MPRFLKLPIGMVRLARPWEWGYFATLVALTMLALFSGSIGIPRLLAGFMALICVFMGCGSFFIVDSLHTRWDRLPAHLK
jgi:Flp pilus assembly pilin Flp